MEDSTPLTGDTCAYFAGNLLLTNLGAID